MSLSPTKVIRTSFNLEMSKRYLLTHLWTEVC